MEFSENKNDQSVLLDLTTRERRGKRGGGRGGGEGRGVGVPPRCVYSRQMIQGVKIF